MEIDVYTIGSEEGAAQAINLGNEEVVKFRMPHCQRQTPDSARSTRSWKVFHSSSFILSNSLMSAMYPFSLS